MRTVTVPPPVNVKPSSVELNVKLQVTASSARLPGPSSPLARRRRANYSTTVMLAVMFGWIEHT